MGKQDGEYAGIGHRFGHTERAPEVLFGTDGPDCEEGHADGP
jgi:hypothetical protein